MSVLFQSTELGPGQQQRLQDHFPLACFHRKEDVFPLLYCSIFSLDVLLCTLEESGLSCVAVVIFLPKLLVKRETRILGFTFMDIVGVGCVISLDILSQCYVFLSILRPRGTYLRTEQFLIEFIRFLQAFS